MTKNATGLSADQQRAVIEQSIFALDYTLNQMHELEDDDRKVIISVFKNFFGVAIDEIGLK